MSGLQLCYLFLAVLCSTTQSKQSCPSDGKQQADKSWSDGGTRRENCKGEWKGCVWEAVWRGRLCMPMRDREVWTHSELSGGCQEPCWYVWALMHHPRAGGTCTISAVKSSKSQKTERFSTWSGHFALKQTKKCLPRISLPYRSYRVSRAIPSRVAAEG